MLRGGARTFGAFGRAAAQQSFGFRPNQRAAFAAFRKFHAHRDFQLEHYRTTNAPPLGQSGPSALVNFLSDLSASEAFLHAPGVAAEALCLDAPLNSPLNLSCWPHIKSLRVTFPRLTSL